jgi:hypothetical protein
MLRPLIGITSSLNADGHQVLDHRYVEAVERCSSVSMGS